MSYKTKRPVMPYNQAIEMNDEYYHVYIDWLIGIALNRFKWKNLPETCDARTIEYQLLTQGCVTIARPPQLSETWLSLGAVFSGDFDLYGYPTRWRTWSNWTDKWDFEVTPANGVFAWANNSRRSPWIGLDKYAQELAKIKRIREINRVVQNTPFAINCDPNARKEAENLIVSIMSGQPAVGCMRTRDGELLTDVGVFDVKVDYQPDAFNTDYLNAMGEALNFLGIDYLPRKNERVIEDEVYANSDGVYKKRMDDLNTRLKLADDFNKLTDNAYNVSVEWDTDMHPLSAGNVDKAGAARDTGAQGSE